MSTFIEKTFLSAFDSVAKINIQNRTITFLKNNIHKISPNTQISTEQFSQTYWEMEKIHPDDVYLFEINLSPSAIKRIIDERYGGLLFSYRTLYQSQLHHGLFCRWK